MLLVFAALTRAVSGIHVCHTYRQEISLFFFLAEVAKCGIRAERTLRLIIA